MSDFIIDFEILKKIVDQSAHIGFYSSEYAESLEDLSEAMCNIVEPLQYIENANDHVREKIKSLKKKSVEFYDFSIKMNRLLEKANEVDEEVARLIQINHDHFLNHHESLRIKGWRVAIINWLVDIKNQSPFLEELARKLQTSNENMLNEKQNHIGFLKSIFTNSIIVMSACNNLMNSERDKFVKQYYDNYSDDLFEEIRKRTLKNLLIYEEDGNVIGYNWEALKELMQRDPSKVSQAEYEGMLDMYTMIFSKVGTPDGVDWKSLEKFIECGYINDRLIPDRAGNYGIYIKTEQSPVFRSFMEYYIKKVTGSDLKPISTEELEILNSKHDNVVKEQYRIRKEMFNVTLFNELMKEEYKEFETTCSGLDLYDSYIEGPNQEDISYFKKYGAKDKEIISFIKNDNFRRTFDIEIKFFKDISSENEPYYKKNILYWDYQSGENAKIDQSEAMSDYIKSLKKDGLSFTTEYIGDIVTGKILDKTIEIVQGVSVNLALAVKLTVGMGDFIYSGLEQYKTNVESSRLTDDYEYTKFLEATYGSAQLTFYDGKIVVDHLNFQTDKLSIALLMYIYSYNHYNKELSNFKPISIEDINDIFIEDYVEWYHDGFTNSDKTGKELIEEKVYQKEN